MLSRVKPACSPEVEAIVTQTIGCALRVHTALGPGYTELVYQDAMAIELTRAGLPFSREYGVPIYYRGQLLSCPRVLDFVPFVVAFY